MRALAAELAKQGLDAPALARLARRMRQADAALEAAAAQALAELRAGEAARLDGAALAALPDEIALRVLARALAELGGEARLERLERLAAALLEALRAGRPFAGTLGGCLVCAGAGGDVRLRRESPRRGRESGRH
jgi:tRNA(Ile)-lysidine synthase